MYLKFHREINAHSHKRERVEWLEAGDVQRRVKKLVDSLELAWIDFSSLTVFRSRNSKARAYARIWGLSKVWQLALKQKPAYIIEVISERFDSLPEQKQNEVLLHELAHIPKNFSGALIPHFRHGNRKFKDLVQGLVTQYEHYHSSRK